MREQGTQQGRVLTRGVLERTESRVYPLKTTKITATTIETAVEIIKAPQNEILLFQGLNFSNGSNDPVFVTCLSVPDGETAGDEHIVIDAIEVERNAYISLSANLMIAPLGRFLVFASDENRARVSGWLKANL